MNLVPFIREGLESAVGDELGVTLDLPADLWPVRCHGPYVARVVYNLALNARQASDEQGSLCVRGRNVCLSRATASTLTSGRYVRLSVSDTGHGIPAKALPHVFEPYFTTKPTGRGVGLSACRAMMLRIGGDVTVESEAGQGTTFHVYLPSSFVSEPPGPPSSRD